MAQLLVRHVEPLVVKNLRNRAAPQGVSIEEAHRRLLRATLIGTRPDTKQNFLEYLRSIPKDKDMVSTRASDLPRSVTLK